MAIGQGAFGIVYRIDPETIVKVYQHSSKEEVKKLSDVAKKAFLHGIPTAISYDLVESDDKYGVIFELIRSDTLARELTENPALLNEYVQKLYELMKITGITDISDFIDLEVNDFYKSVYADVKELFTKEEWEQLVDLIDSIPRTKTMLHSDLHARNLMVQNGELLLIDLDELMLGHPIFDLASIYFSYHDVIHNPDGEALLGLPKELCIQFLDRLLGFYFQDLSQEEKEKVLKAIQIVAEMRFILTAMLYTRADPDRERAAGSHYFYVQEIREKILPRKEEQIEGLALYPDLSR